MAEAVQGGHDCVITIGGIQSNHARATAVAARCMGCRGGGGGPCAGGGDPWPILQPSCAAASKRGCSVGTCPGPDYKKPLSSPVCIPFSGTWAWTAIWSIVTVGLDFFPDQITRGLCHPLYLPVLFQVPGHGLSPDSAHGARRGGS